MKFITKLLTALALFTTMLLLPTVALADDTPVTIDLANLSASGTGYTYDSSSGALNLLGGHIFTFTGSFSGKVNNNGTMGDGGTFTNLVENYSTISGSTFSSTVMNKSSGVITNGIFTSDSLVLNSNTISGGTFSGTVKNNGPISGGTFNGAVMNNDSGDIVGGTFNGTVTSAEPIHGGTFNGDVENNYPGDIYGGTFNGDVQNNNLGDIYGGVFNASGSVYNNGTINSGTFNGTVHNGATTPTVEHGLILGGTFNHDVLNTQGSIENTGIYNGHVDNQVGSDISSGTFTSSSTVQNSGTITGGDFYGTVSGNTPNANIYSLSVAPRALAFGSAAVGYTQPAAQTVTVSNTGNQSVMITISADAQYFTVAPGQGFTDTTATLAAQNDTASFTVQPKAGLAAGTYAVNITIDPNNVDMLQYSAGASFTVTGGSAPVPSSAGGVALASMFDNKRNNNAAISLYNASTPQQATISLTGVGLSASDALITENVAAGQGYNSLLNLAGSNEVVSAYNISLRSGVKSTGSAMSLSFKVGVRYAGQDFTLVHQKADATYEYFYNTADASGVLEFGPLYELSPFMLVRGLVVQPVVQPVAASDILPPQTGESGSAALVLAAGAMFALAIGIAVCRVNGARREG